MKKLIQTIMVTVALFLLATASVAHAQSRGGSAIGVGAETMLAPGGGGIGNAAEFVYDTGAFHIDGLLIFVSTANNNTAFGLGGRFFYVLHSGASADFSVGGGLAIINNSPDVGDSQTDILLDGGAKIRAFISDNVALHTTLGLSFYVPDGGDNTISIASRLLGNVGMTYFFR